MILEEIKNIKSDRKDIRNFGLIVGTVLVGIGLYFLWKGNSTSYYLIGVGIGLNLFGLLLPLILKPLYFVWMGFAVVMGFVMTRVILTFLFYIILTPMRFFATLTGKKFIDKYPDKKKTSYWVKRSIEVYNPQKSEHQF